MKMHNRKSWEYKTPINKLFPVLSGRTSILKKRSQRLYQTNPFNTCQKLSQILFRNDNQEYEKP